MLRIRDRGVHRRCSFVIAWHRNAFGESATVEAGGIVFGRLHALPDRWQFEHHGGIQAGGANSVPNAKRSALEALAKALSKAAFEVDVALRSV
jgi:hypothetical protein